MSGVNKVILIGNIAADPEIRYLEGGIAVAKVRLAVTETRKNKEGVRVDHTEWVNVNFWRTTGENAEKVLKKGMLIYIEGKLRTRSWVDKDGNKKNSTDIEGDTFQLLYKREEHIPSVVTDYHKAAEILPPIIDDGLPTDDLPF